MSVKIFLSLALLLVFIEVSSAQGNARQKCIRCSEQTVSGACAGYGTVYNNITKTYATLFAAGLTVDCPVGTSTCYSLITVTPGAIPWVRRGCGLIPCNYLSGAVFGGCDDTNFISAPTPLDQTRSFITAGDRNHATSYTLKYCAGSPNCNSDPFNSFALPAGNLVLMSDNNAAPQEFAGFVSVLIATFTALIL